MARLYIVYTEMDFDENVSFISGVKSILSMNKYVCVCANIHEGTSKGREKFN